MIYDTHTKNASSNAHWVLTKCPALFLPLRVLGVFELEQ